MVRNLWLRPTATALRHAALIALSSALSLFSSCEFLALNIMPSYLSRAEGFVDLKGALEDAGLSSVNTYVNELRFVSAGGYDYAVAIASDGSLLANIFIDLDGMKVKKVLTGSDAGDTVLADMEGMIAVGTSWYSWIDQYVPGSFGLSASPAISNSFGNNAGDLTTSGATDMLWVSGSYLYLSGYNPWNNSAVYYPGALIDSSYSFNGNAASAAFDGSKARVLLTGGGASLVLTFPSFALMELALDDVYWSTYPDLYNHPNVSHALLPSGDDESGWMTPGGAILLHHDNGTRLIRYDADSGKELDSFPINDSEGAAYGFSSNGKKWLFYEGTTGKLHLLRTWW